MENTPETRQLYERIEGVRRIVSGPISEGECSEVEGERKTSHKQTPPNAKRVRDTNAMKLSGSSVEDHAFSRQKRGLVGSAMPYLHAIRTRHL